MYETATPTLFAITVSNNTWQPAKHLLLLSDKLARVASGDLKRLMVFMPPRHGKECADSTPVLTLNGWSTHGKLRVGDYVFGLNGQPIKVIAVSSKTKSNQRVEFTNGEIIDCHENHEWTVYNRSCNKWATYETKDFSKITKFGKKKQVTSKNRSLYQLPLTSAVQFSEKTLMMPPYVLGAWLGDGTSNAPCITHAKHDHQTIDSIAMHYPISAVSVHKTTGCITTRFSSGSTKRSIFTSHLQSTGVFKNKHIPTIYKQSSIPQRLELLAGLIDTDGHADKNSRVCIATVSKILAEDIAEVVRSMGWHAYIMKQKPILSTSGIHGKKIVYYIGFNPDQAIPTRIPRKKIIRCPVKRRIGIKSVTEIEGEMGNCIQVNSPNGLYLVGKKLIPTHNSELISKYFPAWYLGHHPDNRIILSSYEADFAASWGWKVRNILTEYGNDIFGITVNPDSTARNRWDIARHEGGMNTAGVGGAITGKGANLFLIDDPVKNAEEAHSKLKRDKAWDWFQSTAYTRLEPGGAIILIMTRWHKDDLGGRILTEADHVNEKWDVLNLPAIAEENDVLGRKVGEPLWAKRYPIETLKKIQGTVGEYWWSSMYQQSPYIRTGGMFERPWFEIIDAAPKHKKRARVWDLAATEENASNDPDYTVGLLMSEQNGVFCIHDVIRIRANPGKIEALIKQTAQMDGIETDIYIEQEPGSSGKALINNYARTILKGYSMKGVLSTGKKQVRAKPFSAACSNGNVKLVDGVWIINYLSELEAFPNGVHDDQVDASSLAFNKLIGEGVKLTNFPISVGGYDHSINKQ